MTITRSCVMTLAIVICSWLAGCADHQHVAPRPARINHVVFFKLHDPAQTQALIDDCDALLRTMPMVRAYWAGVHIDTGRATVDGDYHVGAYVGFDSVEDYAAYLAHPNHDELVTRWRPQLQWLRVYDVLDETP